MKNQENMTGPKEMNKVPITEMKIYEIFDKEFLIILLQKFSKLQEHRQAI